MPGCCALGCTNRSEHGYRMFLLPQGDRNEDRRLQWVKNIGRPDVPSKSVVCEKHFTPDQFENNRQDNKRLLKWNAVPTLFDRSVCTKVSRRKIMKDVFNKQERMSSGNLQDLAEDEIVTSNTEDTNTVNNSRKQFIEQLSKTSKIKDISSVASRKSPRTTNHITLSNVDLPKENKTTVLAKKKTLFNKRARNLTAKKMNTSKLEDFAEVISEEPLPKRSRVAILGHKKKPLVKKLVRVSTENICRLCGKLSDTLQPIFGDVARNKHVPFIINQHLPVQVSETDIGWPRNICEICVKNLIEWEVLYNKCKDIDVTFKKMLKQPSALTCVSANAVSNKNTVAGVSCDDNVNNSISNLEVHKKEIIDHHTHDHNYCPTKQLHGTKESLSICDKHSTKNILEVVENTSNKSVVPSTKLKNKDETNEHISSLSYNDDKPLQINVDNNNTFFLNDKKSAADKLEYKICVSLVKNKDANEDAELQFSSLKSILIDKVNELFQSICTDKTIGKSLINTSDRTCDDEHNNCTDCINGEMKVKDEVGITSSFGNDDNEYGIKRNCMSWQKDSLIKPAFKSKIKHSSTSKLTGLMIKPRGNVTSARKNDDGPFLCTFCGHIAQKRRSFSQHRRVHHIEKKCNYCDLTLPSFFEYRRHIRLLHKDRISNYCCDLCGAKFIKKERLERHKLIIHNVGEYLFCDICNKKCASKQQLHCHKSDVHHKEKNLCQYCGQYFISHNAFLSHLRQKHYKKNTHSCVICDKKFTNSTSFTLHLARHASGEKSDDNKIASALLDRKMNSCLICNVKIDDINMLQQHMSYHADDEDVKMLDGNDKGLFKCNLCDKYLDKEKDLALHRFYFHKEPPFACLLDDCNCTFWRRSALVVHQITSHKKYMHCCKICSESFSNIKDKQRHMKIHHPDPLKLFKCVQCDKQFSSEANLKIHMVVHSDIRKYKCHLCGKSFKLKLTLSRHLQFHKKNDIQHTDIKKSTFAELGTDVVEGFIICDAEQQLQENFQNCSDIYKICTMFKCPSCNILFTHRDILENHTAEAHSDEGELVNYELIDVLKLTMEDGSEFI
ncbi:uncharacterized protein LOC142325253 [Lycorma delicatula]|uniref:uncharacterized protein LOC142325253 n=1 Tax=Lycorma delicatula TaxID=130591 RepID=UPI003F51A014